MTTTPQRNVFINVYLPALQISLGFVQAASFWANPPAGASLAWRQVAAVKTKWDPGQLAYPVDWK